MYIMIALALIAVGAVIAFIGACISASRHNDSGLYLLIPAVPLALVGAVILIGQVTTLGCKPDTYEFNMRSSDGSHYTYVCATKDEINKAYGK